MLVPRRQATRIMDLRTRIRNTMEKSPNPMAKSMTWRNMKKKCKSISIPMTLLSACQPRERAREKAQHHHQYMCRSPRPSPREVRGAKEARDMNPKARGRILPRGREERKSHRTTIGPREKAKDPKARACQLPPMPPLLLKRLLPPNLQP